MAEPRNDVREAGLRICIVTAEFVGLPNSGGIGTALTGLALCLAGAGHQVTVCYTRAFALTPAKRRKIKAVWREKGIVFDGISPQSLGRYAGPFVDLAYTMPSAVFDYLKANDFDLVHFNEMEADGLLALSARRFGLAFPTTPMAVGVHSPTRWINHLNGTATNLVIQDAIDASEQCAIASADVLWCPSRYLLHWIADQGFRLPEMVEQRPYVLPPLPDLPGLPASDVDVSVSLSHLVFFGRLEVRKGFFIFLDAVERIMSKLAEKNITVTFLGHDTLIDGVYASEILKQRSKKWLVSAVHLSGLDQPKALAQLKQAGRLAVMASPADNSPCVVYEAMEAGIPFLAARAGGIPELIADAYSERVLFEPNAEELAKLIAKALDVPLTPPKPKLTQAEVAADWLCCHSATDGWPAKKRSRSILLNPEPYTLVLIHSGPKATLFDALKKFQQAKNPPGSIIVATNKPFASSELPPNATTTKPQDIAIAIEQHKIAGGMILIRTEIILDLTKLDAFLDAAATRLEKIIVPSVDVGGRDAHAPPLTSRLIDALGPLPTGMLWMDTETTSAALSYSVYAADDPVSHIVHGALAFSPVATPLPLTVGKTTKYALRHFRRNVSTRTIAGRSRRIIYLLMRTPAAALVPFAIKLGRAAIEARRRFFGL